MLKEIPKSPIILSDNASLLNVTLVIRVKKQCSVTTKEDAWEWEMNAG